MLRNLLVFSIIAYGAVNAFRGPFHALLLYLFIAYFRPDYWLWDTSLYASFNFSLITGIVLLLSSLVAWPRWRFDSSAWLLWLFLLQDTASLFGSQYYSYAYPFWLDFARAVTISYLISVLVDDLHKFRQVLLVISLSLGFEAAKQGWAEFFINPGGQNFNSTEWIGDNNLTAVAMFMLVPIIGALAQTAPTRWERYAHRLFAIGVLYRGITTYSRGGFLACLALAAVSLLRSTHKARNLATILVLGILVVPVLPAEFWERMSTINASEEDRDASAASRLYFWEVAVTMANSRPFLGLGHNSYNVAYNTFDQSRGKFGINRSVHSAWFGTLAEVGYPGLLLLVTNVAAAALRCGRIRRLAKTRPEVAPLLPFATAFELSFVVFGVGATFVIFQYSEMLWHFVALSAALGILSQRALGVNTLTPPSPANPPGASRIHTRAQAAVRLAR